MVRVAHLTSVHPTFDVRIFQKECKSLIQAGYDLVLIAPHGKDEILEGVPVRTIERPHNKILRILTGSWRIYQAVRKDNRQIYHFHDTELIPLGLLLRLRGKQVIYDMHENAPGALSTKEWIPASLRQPISKIFEVFERLVLNNFHVIFAEKSYADEYPWLKQTSIVLNYPLADQLLQINAEKFVQPTIGYVGDVREDRGAVATIEALTLLQRKGTSPHWLCMGRINDKLRERLEKVVEAERLSVDFRGYTVSKEAHPLVAKTHIGLAVVARTPNNIGSLLTKLFEYMALGIPLITSDFPLYKELIEGIGCGICVAPEKPQELADAIEYLLFHPEEAAEMGRRGREAVRANYNWNTEAKKLLEVYQTLSQNY
jgi:glycosyltransferase involved in cell wall biosynthesis